ncbi:AbiTii domain-containing protein [Catenibacterium sp.]|uniref:AbiTii domain-containing protein n=1 Tax=Catenibacterium sp. TaxID=2049022 RepID=UPI003FD8F180
MASIVLDLQKEILSPNCDIVNVLRKAHLIAVKLKLSDFDQWIQYELSGYPNKESCPEDRKGRGALKYLNQFYGWIPIIIQNNEIEKIICERKMSNSISEIVFLSDSSENELIAELSGEESALLDKNCNTLIPQRYALHISITAAKDIEEKVKNAILDWTLKLEEEGIVGENMMFTDKEKDCATNIPQTVNNYYGPTSVINSSSGNAQIVSGNGNTVSFPYDKVKDVVDEVAKSISASNLSKDDMETITELLSDIKLKSEE